MANFSDSDSDSNCITYNYFTNKSFPLDKSYDIDAVKAFLVFKRLANTESVPAQQQYSDISDDEVHGWQLRLLRYHSPPSSTHNL
jgi:hypothetical protein